MSISLHRFAALVLFSSLVTACGSNPERQSEFKEITPPSRYKLAYIGSVSVTLLDGQPDEQRSKDKKILEEKIPSLVLSAIKEQGLAVSAARPGQGAGVVAVNLKLQYDPGNRAARWVAGIFGAGKGEVEAYIEGVDPGTGTLIASKVESDTKSGGLLGGDFYGMVESTVENVAGELAETLLEVRM